MRSLPATEYKPPPLLHSIVNTASRRNEAHAMRKDCRAIFEWVFEKIRRGIIHRLSLWRLRNGNLWHHVVIDVFQHRYKHLLAALHDQTRDGIEDR
jgi:hypothetical protein